MIQPRLVVAVAIFIFSFERTFSRAQYLVIFYSHDNLLWLNTISHDNSRDLSRLLLGQNLLKHVFSYFIFPQTNLFRLSPGLSPHNLSASLNSHRVSLQVELHQVGSFFFHSILFLLLSSDYLFLPCSLSLSLCFIAFLFR